MECVCCASRERELRGSRSFSFSRLTHFLAVAEQWATDLTRALPKLAVSVVSANKVVSLLGTADLGACVQGFQASGAPFADAVRNSVVLVVSQSGQTFPVLHAARLVRCSALLIYGETFISSD